MLHCRKCILVKLPCNISYQPDQLIRQYFAHLELYEHVLAAFELLVDIHVWFDT